MLDETSPIVPLYEQKRLLLPDATVNPELFRDKIKQSLQTAIDNAPTVTVGSVWNLTDEEEANCSLVFRYPEDAHMATLAEPMLFAVLSEIDLKLKKSGQSVSRYTLMGVDPRISALQVRTNKGDTVTGETYLQHELKHAEAAAAEGQKQVYILVHFTWVVDEKGEKKLKIPREITKVTPMQPDAMIRIALAPKYPSAQDFDDAMHFYKQLRDSDFSKWEEMKKYITTLPNIFIGDIWEGGLGTVKVNFERHMDILLPQWQKLVGTSSS